MPFWKRKMRKRKRAGNPRRVEALCKLSCGHSRAPIVRAVWLAVVAGVVLAFGAGTPRLLAKKKPAPVRTISGAVLNSSNSGVAGAAVMLTDVEAHRTDTVYSGADGKYSFDGLNPNEDYTVQAKYRELTSDVRHVSSLDSRVKVVVNLVLGSPGSAASADAQ